MEGGMKREKLMSNRVIAHYPFPAPDNGKTRQVLVVEKEKEKKKYAVVALKQSQAAPCQ